MTIFVLDYELISPEQAGKLRSRGSFLLKVLGIKEGQNIGDERTPNQILIEELTSSTNQFFYRVSLPSTENTSRTNSTPENPNPIIYDESGFSSGAGLS